MPNAEFTSQSASRSTPANCDFRCPACRARQPVQNTCRRCEADLTLLAKIHLRIDYLVSNPSSASEGELAMLIATGHEKRE